MSAYRIYQLDERGDILSGVDVDCDDDQQAYETAEKLLTIASFGEVWAGARRVGRVDAKH